MEKSKMIRQIAHVCTFARDLAESEKFYGGALGLEKGFEFIRGGEVIGVYFKAGSNTFIEIFKNTEASGDGQIRHFCLETDDIEAIYNSLKANGYEATEIKTGRDGSLQVWTADPDGVKIEFHHYTTESAQFKGGKVFVD